MALLVTVVRVEGGQAVLRLANGQEFTVATDVLPPDVQAGRELQLRFLGSTEIDTTSPAHAREVLNAILRKG